jgi:hypothetical protein
MIYRLHDHAMHALTIFNFFKHNLMYDIINDIINDIIMSFQGFV